MPISTIIPASLGTSYALWNLSGVNINYTAGYVGIGGTPAAKLQVFDANGNFGGSAANSALYIGSSLTGNNATTLGFGTGSGSTFDILLFAAGANPANAVYFNNRNNAPMVFQTNNTERMRIDASGIVTTPYQPAFEAVLTSTVGSVQYTTANSEIVFNTANTNIGSCYSTSTGRFTAPVAGVYQFSMIGMTQATSWYLFRKNGASFGSPINQYATTQAGYWAQSGATTIVSLAAGDYISVFTGAGGNGIYGGGNNHNVFCGRLIG